MWHLLAETWLCLSGGVTSWCVVRSATKQPLRPQHRLKISADDVGIKIALVDKRPKAKAIGPPPTIRHDGYNLFGPREGDEWPGLFLTHQLSPVVEWLRDGEDRRSLAMVLWHADKAESERARQERIIAKNRGYYGKSKYAYSIEQKRLNRWA